MIKKELISILKNCLPVGSSEAFSLHEPNFSKTEENNVLECIRTGWVSYQGKFVSEFEEKLAKFCDAKHAVVVSSGTVALFITLKALGIEEKDEVLVPSLTFIATANAVHHIGAIAHFVEVSKESLGIDSDKLDQYLANIGEFNNGKLINKNTGRTIKAIIPVHIFGHPVDMDKLVKVAKKYSLIIIEDGAESLGSKYKNQQVGAFGEAGILSFNGNKIITTGGGGAIITNSDDLAKDIKHLTTTAKKVHPYEFVHDQIGYNFRMPNLNAALGVAQLDRINYFLEKKRALAMLYIEAFKNSDSFEFVKEPSYAMSNYWLNAITISKPEQDNKDDLIQALHSEKIYARPLWRPLHMLEIYRSNPRCSDLSITEDLYNKIICLPSSAFLYDLKKEDMHSNK